MSYRESLPQTAARQFQKYIFERRRKHFQALQLDAFRFQMLDQRDDGLRRLAGMQKVGLFELAAIRDAIEFA